MRRMALTAAFSAFFMSVAAGWAWSVDMKSAISEIGDAFSISLTNDEAGKTGSIKVVVYTTDMKGVVKGLSAIKWEKIQSVVKNFSAKTLFVNEGKFFDVGGRSYMLMANDGSVHLNYISTDGKMGSIAVDDETHTFITEDGYIFSISKQHKEVSDE